MKYLDVYVVISPARDGDFEVNVASDAGGEGNSILKLPFAMHDLAGVMFGGDGDRGIGRINADGTAASIGTASTFGVQLFEALFQGETREVLSRTESEAKRMADTGVRIRLSMNLAAEGMAEVASLPWELMRRRDQSPLVVSVQTPVVRAFDTPQPIFLQPMKGKLRILALVSNPTGTATLNLQEEKDRIGAIWSKLANVEVDFVRPVEEEILNHLAEHEYHVIHYMGHGDFDSGAGGLLMLERDDGSAHLVDGDTFAAWLKDEPLRLIFLNACNTGTTGAHNGLHPFAGVASALIRSGKPAVLAMQFPISDKSAIIFAQTFYQRIAQSFPVDAAVSDGRKRLLSSDGAEWATPVLYMRAADGNLFDNTRAATTPRKRAAAKNGDDAPADVPRAAHVAESSHAASVVDAVPPQPVVTEPAAKPVSAMPERASEVVAPVAEIVPQSPPEDEVEAPSKPWHMNLLGNWRKNLLGILAISFGLMIASVVFDIEGLESFSWSILELGLIFLLIYYALPASKRWYQKALVIGIAAVLLSGSFISLIPVTEIEDTPEIAVASAPEVAAAQGEAVAKPLNVVPDPNNPATAAIAQFDAGRWINNDADIAVNVLKSASIADIKALADAGYDKAQFVMGEVYSYRLGGAPESIALAAQYYDKAASQGLAEAEYNAGWFYIDGLADEKDSAGVVIKGITKDPVKAKNLLRRAVAQGNLSAWQTLVNSYGEIIIVPDTTNLDTSEPAGAAIAAIDPARWINDVTPTLAKSVLASAKSDDIYALTSQGNARASYVYGRLTLDGLDNYQVSKRLAADHMVNAAKAGIPQAMYYMGTFTATGLPKEDDVEALERNDIAAKGWFKKAAELGNTAARAELEAYDTKYPPAN